MNLYAVVSVKRRFSSDIKDTTLPNRDTVPQKRRWKSRIQEGGHKNEVNQRRGIANE